MTNDINFYWQQICHFLADVLISLSGFLTTTTQEQQRVSDVVNSIKDILAAQIIFFVIAFAIIIGPKLRLISQFYLHLRSPKAIPAYTKIGISHAGIESVKNIITVYILYLIYQVIQFFLLIDNDGLAAKTFDFGFQFILTFALLITYNLTYHRIVSRWEKGDIRRNKIADWLDTKLDNIDIKYSEIRRNVLVLFTFNFGPTAIVWLPKITPSVALALQKAAETLKTI